MENNNFKTAYYELTHPQKRIWYSERLFPNSCIGNNVFTCRLDGPKDVEKLHKAINLLIKNTDSLRLRITEKEGKILQYISEYRFFSIIHNDFSSKEGKKKYEEWLNKNLFSPIANLDSDLFYFETFISPKDDLEFLLKMNHVITDGSGTAVCTNYITTAYNTLLSNGEALLETNSSYVDYIKLENKYKESEKFLTDKTFWHEYLANMPDTNSFKSSLHKPGVKAKRAAFYIPKNLENKIELFCKENKISIFVLFIAAWSLYVHKTTGQDDITAGTFFHNRVLPGTKKMVGNFISTAPFRIIVDKDDINFKELLTVISKNLRTILPHQQYPYDLLVQDLKKEKKITEGIFDTAFSYVNIDFNTPIVWHFHEAQDFPLMIHVRHIKDEARLKVELDYQINMFTRNEIVDLYNHLFTLLERGVSRPEEKISSFNILLKNEEEKILTTFNNTTSDFPSYLTIQELFEEQVKKNPDKKAVIFGDTFLTYSQLNKKANQIANLLRNKGIGRDSVVGILLNRSLEMFIGIFGIIKAGGAYLPITPDLPEKRFNKMINSCGIKTVLTKQEFLKKDKSNIEFINLDDDAVYTEKEGNPDKINTPRDLAYVIYTSGSTGEPKGVMIEHRSLINRLDWMQKKYPLSSNDIILHKTPFSFDVSVWEIFWWSFYGASVFILPPMEEKIPKAIVDAVKDNNISVMHTVPSMLNGLLEYLEVTNKFSDISTLKNIFSSGEELKLFQVQKVNNMLNKAYNTELINLYGPTEAAIDVSYYNCSENLDAEVVPIGKPINNIKLYIVNKKMELQPIGVAGELCIGGVGLARGYINSPDQTAKYFIDNPFSSGEKLYKTGDFAKWLPDGNILFLGRGDSQIKIRGIRVELGEIEKHIQEHELIKEAAVLVKQIDEKENILCAYYTSDQKIDDIDIKKSLASLLPDYMIPLFFIKIDHIPLTESGKLNPKALPEPKGANIEKYIAPKTDTEKALVDIWKKVLKVQKIGINDNFFDLGGNSLDLIKVNNEMIKLFNKEIPIVELFIHTTISSLLSFLEENDNLKTQVSETHIEESIDIMTGTLSILSEGDVDE